jgi:hypothetical protein
VTDYPPPQRQELIWAAVDLDGTLAEPLWTPDNPTSEIGDPIWLNVEKLGQMANAGYKIVIHTSRGWTDYERIEAWLNHHKIPWHHIVCGKLLAAVYVDDRARHADESTWLRVRDVNDVTLYNVLLDRCGFQDGGEATSDGSASNDLAHERASAVMRFVESARGHMYPADLLSGLAGAETRLEYAERQARFYWSEAFKMAERAGWSPFGTHLTGPDALNLEFDGLDECQMPIWERPKQ